MSNPKWQTAFDKLIASQDYVVVDLIGGGPVDGRCTKIDDGVYRMEHSIIEKNTGEETPVETIFPIDSVVWAGSCPVPKSKLQNAGALTMDEIARIKEAQ